MLRSGNRMSSDRIRDPLWKTTLKAVDAMRIWVLLAILIVIALSCDVHARVIAISGGTLISPHLPAPLENSVIVLEGERIAEAGKKGDVTIPDGAEVIQASGKWIIPGLIDGHVHFFQSGSLYTRPDIIDLREQRSYEDELKWIKDHIEDAFTRYIRSGVTSVVDMGGPLWNFKVREQAGRASRAPRVAVAGPLISTYQPSELTTEDPPIIKVNSPEEARREVDRQAAFKPDFIKIWFIPLPGHDLKDYLSLIEAIVEESHRRGIRVAVHATELEAARIAVAAGADILVHSVQDRVVDEEFVGMLKQKGNIYIPTLMVSLRYDEAFSQRLELTPPELRIANPYVLSTLTDLGRLPQGNIPSSIHQRMKASRPARPNAVSLRNLKRLQEAGVTVAAGTDAGNIGTPHGPAMFREFELMEQAGLSAQEILTAATANGAKLMGKLNELGTIEEGKLADLVVLNADPLSNIRNISNIHLVIKDGHIYSPSQ